MTDWNFQKTSPIQFDTFRGVIITNDGHTYAGLIVPDIARLDRKVIQCFPPYHHSKDIVTVDVADIYVWMMLPVVSHEPGKGEDNENQSL